MCRTTAGLGGNPGGLVGVKVSRHRLDALVSLALPRVALVLDNMDPSVNLSGLISYTAPLNITGQPALSIPCGFGEDDLPVDLQIVERSFDETIVLRIGSAYEQSAGWHEYRPELITA